MFLFSVINKGFTVAEPFLSFLYMFEICTWK